MARQTVTLLTGLPTATNSIYDYFFADANTRYTVDGRNSGTGGLEKWTSNGSTWTMALSKLAAGTTGLRSLAGMVDAAGNVTLFGGSTGTQGNTLFGYNIKQIAFIRGTFRVVHAWTGKSTWHVNLVVGFTLVGNSHHQPQCIGRGQSQGAGKSPQVARKKWRERFRRTALSSFSSNSIVQNICNLFRFSADIRGSARGNRLQIRRPGYSRRQLRIEGLEVRQMLSTTPWNLGAREIRSRPPTVVDVDDSWAGTTLGTDADGAGNIVPNWTGIGGNANGSEFGVDEFATIQDAINAVASGGQIYVYGGTYAQPLVVNKTVSMFGFQAGIDARTQSATESIIGLTWRFQRSSKSVPPESPSTVSRLMATTRATALSE